MPASTPADEVPTDEEPANEAGTLARALHSHLARQERRGIRRTARPAPPADVSPRAKESPPARKSGAFADELVPAGPAPTPSATDSPAVAQNRTLARACASLGELSAKVADCTACPLSRTRTQTVFKDGSEHARVMFVGEAPGESEDRQGVPFVGAAGQLLTKIIEDGMGLNRSEVYIANVLKCRPPGNRDPEAEEKALCTPFLDRQIELVDPEVVVTLGTHASRHLLRSTLSMGRLRGRIHAWNGRKVVATYHPAYLLRNPAAKKDCWQDIQLAMRQIGLEPPA